MKAKIITILIAIFISISSFSVLGNTVNKNVDCSCSETKTTINSMDSENQFYTGLIADEQIKGGGVSLIPTSITSIDWRNYNGEDYTTPVKNQKACGSCYVFGAIAAAESAYEINVGGPDSNPDFSEQFIVSCGREKPWIDDYHDSMNGCFGGTLTDASWFIEKWGAIQEDCFKYVSGTDPYEMYWPSCSNKCSNWKENSFKITDWHEIQDDVEDIKSAIVNYGPVVTGFRVESNFIYEYPDKTKWPNDVFTDIPTGEIGSLHATLIVGFQDDLTVQGGGYWICKNSWGEGWGIANPYDSESKGGWFKIAYEECEILDYAIYYDVRGAGEDSLECEGDLIYNQYIYLEPFDKKFDFSGEFTLTNIGDRTVSWKISELPDFGSNWVFKDTDGNKLEDTGVLNPGEEKTIKVSYTIILRQEDIKTYWNNFNGYIKIIDQDNPEDYGHVRVFIYMYKKPLSKSNIFLTTMKFPLLRELIGL